MEHAASLGAWMKQRRRELDMSQEMLAELVGCSAETIRKLETNKRRPSRPFAERLGAVLGIEPADVPRFIAFARAAQEGAAAQPAFRSAGDFIGRQKECAEIAELLAGARLLTLTGMGGIGKSALAHQVAAARSAAYPNGCALIDLAAVVDPAQVAKQALAAFGAPAEYQSLADLRSLLQPKQSLIVLDNCEHLADACASLAIELLSTCPRLQIVVTSRRVLGCY
ncbi:MAG TPA: helix-turn-helix domain-containing protein, partial [Herpetosiphonaceae bacterium]|nr:helix-turn-helix domain-containing protein [Herpetosiphonaceae bacterium]